MNYCHIILDKKMYCIGALYIIDIIFSCRETSQRKSDNIFMLIYHAVLFI